MKSPLTFVPKCALLVLIACLAKSSLAVEVQFYASDVNYWGTYTLTLGNSTISRSSPESNCDSTPFTETNVVDLQPGRTYTMEQKIIPGSGANPSCSQTGTPRLSGANSCYSISMVQLSSSKWEVSLINQRTNTLEFDICCLPADGVSKTTVRIAGPALPGPYTWSISGGGCTIEGTNEWATITAGTQEGMATVKVQALDCTVEGTLELCPVDDGSGGSGGGGVAGGAGGAGGGGGGGFGGGGGGGFEGDSGSGGPSGGCNSCGSRAPGGASAGLNNNGMNVQVNAGGLDTGGSAGFLAIYAQNASTNLYSPLALQYNFSGNGVILVTNAGALGQIKTDRLLGTVVSNSPSGYTIAFYGLTNVLGWSVATTNYITTNSPFAVVRIENPEHGSSTNKLRVTESRDGSSWVFDYEFLSDGWQLTSGNGFRVEKVSRSTNGSIISVTREIKNSSAQVVWTSTWKYQPLTFGMALVERVIGNVLTNNYTYLSNGLPEKTLHADGNWDWFVYDDRGRITNHFSALGLNGPSTNRTLSRLTEYDYTPVSGTSDDGSFSRNTPRKTVEYVAGQEVSRRYAIITHGQRHDIVCQTQGASANDAGNLETITIFNSDLTNRFYGRPVRVVHPRFKLTLYSYEIVGGNTVTTVASGDAGDWGNPFSPSVWFGTHDKTTTDPAGRVLSRISSVIWKPAWLYSENTNEVSWELYSDFDDDGTPLRTDFSDGTFTHALHGCCGPAALTNREGTVITYDYDSLRRLNSVTRDGITRLSVLDPAGNLLASVRGTNGNFITNANYSYDAAGRLRTQTLALGYITAYTNYFDTSGYRVEANTLPDGTIANRYYRDGLLFERTGTATFPETHLYGVDATGYGVQYETIQKGTSTESEKVYTDMLGRVVRRVFNVASGTAPYQLFVYNTGGALHSHGLLIQETDPDGIVTNYEYSDPSMTWLSAEWTQRSTGDRVITEERDYGDSGIPSQRSRTFHSGAEVHSRDISFDGRLILRRDFAVRTAETRIYFGNPADGTKVVTNTAPEGSYSVERYLHGKLLSTTQFDSVGAQIGATTNTYDAHGRLSTSTDARNGTTTYTYNNADQITSITTPVPGPGQSAQTTQHEYDSRGRVWKTTHPDGTSVTNEFYPTGLLKKTYGSRTYPVQYAYDSQGRMTNMTTWQDFASGAGAAATRWKYDAYRGFMTNKLYADGKGTGYTYTNSGKLASRIWARGVTTTYAYNSAGDLHKIIYSDGTPSVTNSYDNRGRITTVQFGTNVASLKYNNAGQLLSEALDGVTVTNGYDSILRRTTNGVFIGGIWTLKATNTYDAASRLSIVSDGTHSATYTYLANSLSVDNIVFKQGGTTRMTTTKTWDKLNRLTKIESIGGGNTVSSHGYAYNAANQRTSVTNTENARWVYTYDKLGQVTSGKKYWNDGIPVAGQQFEYTFDDIGNRKTGASGGNEWGSGLRQGNYTANNLNQYTSRTVPGYVDVIGAASSNATVTVNDIASYRKEEYFRAEVPVTNAIGPIWISLTNVAVLENGSNPDITTNFAGDRYIPKLTQSFTYDVDGNLTNDGRWVYMWDGENRLIGMTSSDLPSSAANLKLEFDYDYMGRRIAKRVYNSTGQLTLNHRFGYDDWHLLVELNATNHATLRQYVWGSDLSGTRHGAAGIGGLLVVNDTVRGPYFCAYDGNGNIATLVNATNSSVAATYEYSPFGEPVRAQGPAARINPFRFSTKYSDEESDLVCFGHRFYNPATGRWLSRDPIGEPGGEHLFAFTRNDPLNRFDPIGLSYEGASPPLAGDWRWYPDPSDSRGGKWRDGSGRSGSWDATDSHWDIDDGRGNRQRYDRWGNPLTKEVAHNYRGPRQRPIRLSACGAGAKSTAAIAVLALLGNLAEGATIDRANNQLTSEVEAALKECERKSAARTDPLCCGCCEITIISRWSTRGSFPNAVERLIGPLWPGVGEFKPPSGYVTDVDVIRSYSKTGCASQPPVPTMIDPTTSTQEIIQIDM